MKKLIYTSILMLLIASGISSCAKKDYTCVCVNTSTGAELSRSTVSATSSEDAFDECDDKESIALPDRCEIQD